MTSRMRPLSDQCHTESDLRNVIGCCKILRMYRRCPRSLIAPGPDGPIGTVRYEMLREGLQELEARIMIERALLAQGVKGPAARNCTNVLLERLRVRLKDGTYKPSPGDYAHKEKQTEMDGVWGIAPNWQDLTKKLYDAAFQAARAAGLKRYCRPTVVRKPAAAAPRTGTRTALRSSSLRSTSREPERPTTVPPDALRERLIADVKKGARVEVELKVGARRRSARVKAASDEGVTLTVKGMEVRFTWERLPREVVESLSRRYSGGR